MSEKSIAYNKFDPRTTKIVYIHDGKFHADDMMFAALATVAADRARNKIEVIRVSSVPTEYRPDAIAGDIGLGIYDHHADVDGVKAKGMEKETETRIPSACGLLYDDIKDNLFTKSSETKNVFSALIDIIEHCDNTPDNNTFSDAINYLIPPNENDEKALNESAQDAIAYCKSVIIGFIEAHEKECSGKKWAVPRICAGIVPGVEDKKQARYFAASANIKSKYRYVSFNDQQDIKLRSTDTYSLASGVLNQRKRSVWKEKIETADDLQIKEMQRRETEVWPKAVANMQHRTIELEQYVPYGPYVKDLVALFIAIPSQRGGYSVNFLKTSNGKYRFNPDMLIKFPGCTFVANDKRFITFESKEKALDACYKAGRTVDLFLENHGINGYRNIYGGITEDKQMDFLQTLIAEDIALNMFVRDKIKNPDAISVDDYRTLQVAVMDNPYLIHSFCIHFQTDGETMSWKSDAQVNTPNLNKDSLLTKTQRGTAWNMGLDNFLKNPNGQNRYSQIHPN